jgi:TPR repeat protein
VAFRRLLPEGAHGTQGPHLHVEPQGAGAASPGVRPAGPAWTVAAPTPAEAAVTRLRQAAVAGDVGAQLALADVYEQGRAAPKDLVAAYVWAATASENGRASPAERGTAAQHLAALRAKMAAADVRRAHQFSQARDASACAAADSAESTVLVLGPERPVGDDGEPSCLE